MYRFPSNRELEELFKSFPFDHFKIEDDDFTINRIDGWEGIKQIPIEQELWNWKIILHNSWNDVAKSFVMLKFYKNQGIPDNPYYISPGENGKSVQYFPNFEKKHHLIKGQFDFYCDVFFYKIFSSLDYLWQLLNLYSHLKIKPDKVKIYSILKRLKGCNPKLYHVIDQMKKDQRFQDAKNYRNNVTHKIPTGEFSSGVQRLSSNTFVICVNEYVSSDKVLRIITDFIDLCGDTIEKMKNVCKAGSAQGNYPAAD